LRVQGLTPAKEEATAAEQQHQKNDDDEGVRTHVRSLSS
jgi:hypothetical protein